MRRDPLRHLTRGLSEAVPHDPAFVAMTEGNGVIQTTWGDLASRLVEADVVEADPAVICDFLCITPEQLSDPDLIFTQYGDDSGLRRRLEEQVEERYIDKHASNAKGDSEKFVANSSQWEVTDVDTRVAEIQAEIDADALVVAELKEEAYWRGRTQLILKGLHRDALVSGTCVSLTDFAKTVLFVEELGYFSTANVVAAVQSVVDMIFERDGLDKGVPAREVFLGKRQIVEFQNVLVGIFRHRITQEQLRRWEAVSGHIYAGSIYDHPLLAGNES